MSRRYAYCYRLVNVVNLSTSQSGFYCIFTKVKLLDEVPLKLTIEFRDSRMPLGRQEEQIEIWIIDNVLVRSFGSDENRSVQHVDPN
jgi:hypothetical protein